MTEKRRILIINESDYKSEDLMEIANGLLEGQLAPSFYLLVQTPKHNGFVITNLDMPVMVIIPEDLHSFAKIFVHELVHLLFIYNSRKRDMLTKKKLAVKNEKW